jgi:hypothetical protein
MESEPLGASSSAAESSTPVTPLATPLRYPCGEPGCGFGVVLPANHGWDELSRLWVAHYDLAHPEPDPSPFPRFHLFRKRR